jgi:hypothetical protein
LLIFLHRSHNIKVDLNQYILSFMYFSEGLSALEVIEFLFICGAILRFFEILLKLWTIPDRHASIFNGKSNLLTKLSSSQIFYFRLGITIFSSLSRLQAFGQLIFGYLILCQLDLISFIKIDVIFEYIDYILDNILKLCGFKTKESFSLINKLGNLKEWTLKHIQILFK